jgi:serine/threonine protein kinase
MVDSKDLKNYISSKNSIIPLNSNQNIYGILGNKYILINKIGKGLSSRVYSGKKIENSSTSKKIPFAFKICKKKYDQKMFIEEGHIFKKLPISTNIIKYIDSGKEILVKKKNQKSTQVLYHIFEYIDHGILYNYIDIEKNLKGFGEIIGRIIFKQILNAVEICHKNGVAHQDIKLENIIVSSNYNFKLIDFGFSIDIFQNNHELRFSKYGTSGYFPPEIYLNKDIDPIKSDIFALGVTLFIIICGYKPFNNAKRTDNYYKKIYRKNYDSYWNEFPFNTNDLSKSFKDMIIRFFNANISERIKSIEEIKNEKWMQECKMDYEKEREILKIEMEKRKKKLDDINEKIIYNNCNDNTA